MNDDANESDPALDELRRQLLAAVDADASPDAMAQILRQGLEAASQSGDMSSVRSSRMAGIIDQFEHSMQGQGNDNSLPEMMTRVGNVNQLAKDAADAALDPTGNRVIALGSAASRLQAAHEVMARRLLDEQGPQLQDGETNAITGLYHVRGISIRSSIERLDPVDDQAAAAVEREQLRRWFIDADDFIRRHHLTVSVPFWPSPPLDQNPNGIAFAGSPEMDAVVGQVCAERGFEIISDVGGNAAEARWEALRRAAVCVFDLTGFSRNLPRPERVAFGQVAYEIGIALTLGRPIVLLASPDGRVPFDIDLAPVLIDPAVDEATTHLHIQLAIDAAFSTSQRGGGETCIDASISHALGQWGADDNGFVVAHGLRQLSEQRDTIRADALNPGTLDPVTTEGVLSNVFGFFGADAPILCKPAWPARYPANRQCFHITAFGPKWATRVQQLVRENCEQQAQPISYLRGDDASDSDIIRSIWDEIGAATHLVVDITDLNLNALIELGMAHALGRNVLLITQDPSRSTYPPSLAKVRRVRYNMDTEGEATLWAALWRFLGDHDVVGEPNAQVVEATDSSAPSAQAQAQIQSVPDDATEQVAMVQPEDFACPQAQHVLAHIVSVVPEPEDEAEEGLLSYVLLVPSLLEGLYAGAHRYDELGKVEPLLNMIAEYFLSVDDLIPDHIGVAGLVDDAYMALSCVEKLNQQSIQWEKPPLVEFEFGELNATVGAMMPDHITEQINAHLDAEILKVSTKNWFANNMGKTLLGAAAFAVVAGAVMGGGGNQNSGDARMNALLQSHANGVIY